MTPLVAKKFEYELNYEMWSDAHVAIRDISNQFKMQDHRLQQNLGSLANSHPGEQLTRRHDIRTHLERRWELMDEICNLHTETIDECDYGLRQHDVFLIFIADVTPGSGAKAGLDDLCRRLYYPELGEGLSF